MYTVSNRPSATFMTENAICRTLLRKPEITLPVPTSKVFFAESLLSIPSIHGFS